MGKCFSFPNSITLPDVSRLPERGQFRQQHGLRAADFLAVYSGNIGVKQGLDIVLEAMKHLSADSIHVMVCGDGACRNGLAKAIEASQIAHLHLLPLQPAAIYESMLIDADVCLITQRQGCDTASFPSKLLTTLAYGRPVLAVTDADSELARVIQESQAGWVVPPGCPECLAAKLQDLAHQPEQLASAGKAGRRYVERFDRPAVLAEFMKNFEERVGCFPPRQ